MGIYNKFDSDLNIEVNKQDLKFYPQYSVSIEEVNTRVLHIFALDDELLNSRVSLEIIGITSLQKVYATGGHRFENFKRLENIIRDRFYTIAM